MNTHTKRLLLAVLGLCHIATVALGDNPPSDADRPQPNTSEEFKHVIESVLDKKLESIHNQLNKLDGRLKTLESRTQSSEDESRRDDSGVESEADNGVTQPEPSEPSETSSDRQTSTVDVSSTLQDPPLPPPDDDLSINERINRASLWAQNAAAQQPTTDFVVSIDFIRSKLGFTSDPARPTGVARYAQRSIADSAELYKTAITVANRFPADADPDQFISAWIISKAEFLNSPLLRSEGTEAQKAWAKFLTDWETQILKTDKSRFREGLLQMPLIVTGLLLDFEKAHIAAVMAGGGPKPSASSSSRGTVPTARGRFGHNHMMNHIMRHHSRAMRRLGY